MDTHYQELHPITEKIKYEKHELFTIQVCRLILMEVKTIDCK